MPDANGWPDADQPGVPLNPERSGWHYVDDQPCEWWGPWGCASGRWQDGDVALKAERFEDYSYGGVCPSSPSELVALLAAAHAAGVREERERAVSYMRQRSRGFIKWERAALQQIADEIEVDYDHTFPLAGVPDDSHG